jgi:two-component system, OmpR family, phosphate regulon sensor histidine kinase PhoR
MDGLASRFTWLLLLTTLGGLMVAAIGWWRDWPTITMVVGCALGAAVSLGRDSLKAYRLADWLRGNQKGPAPRDAGIWGELGYRAEKALRKREHTLKEERQQHAQFLSGIEASPNGVLLLDRNDQIDWCNSVAADHFGLDPVRDLRQRMTNLVRAPAFVAYLQGGEFGEPIVFERPGRSGPLSVLVRPYAGGLKLVLSQDISEREKAEAMRRDFVANVSHEIRTPLTVLGGFVETLATVKLKDGEQRKVLGLMEQQTQRIQALVADLLTLAELEGGPRPAVDRWIPIADLMRRAEADALALSAGRHRIGFHADTALEVAGNESELLSAVGNLVSNAIRYTPDSGRVDVLALRLADGSGSIAVVDTGIGIAREHLPRLTERFYRVDGSRSRETGGTGLGLSIVKHIIQRHGGSLEILSEPGRGSTFRLVLPAARLRVIGGDAAPRVGAPTVPSWRSNSGPDSTFDDHAVLPVARMPGFGDPMPGFDSDRPGTTTTH